VTVQLQFTRSSNRDTPVQRVRLSCVDEMVLEPTDNTHASFFDQLQQSNIFIFDSLAWLELYCNAVVSSAR